MITSFDPAHFSSLKYQKCLAINNFYPFLFFNTTLQILSKGDKIHVKTTQ